MHGVNLLRSFIRFKQLGDWYRIGLTQESLQYSVLWYHG